MDDHSIKDTANKIALLLGVRGVDMGVVANELITLVTQVVEVAGAAIQDTANGGMYIVDSDSDAYTQYTAASYMGGALQDASEGIRRGTEGL